jgi:hypothetical protein
VQNSIKRETVKAFGSDLNLLRVLWSGLPQFVKNKVSSPGFGWPGLAVSVVSKVSEIPLLP